MVQVGEIPSYLSAPKEKLSARVLLILPDEIANYTYRKELPLDKWVIPLGAPVSNSLRHNISLVFEDVLEVKLREGKHEDYLLTLKPSIVSFKTSSPPHSPHQSWAKITLKMDVFDANNELIYSKVESGYGATGTKGVGIVPVYSGDVDFDASQLIYIFSDLPEADFASKKSLASSSRHAIYNAIALLMGDIYDAEEFAVYRKDL